MRPVRVASAAARSISSWKASSVGISLEKISPSSQPNSAYGGTYSVP